MKPESGRCGTSAAERVQVPRAHSDSHGSLLAFALPRAPAASGRSVDLLGGEFEGSFCAAVVRKLREQAAVCLLGVGEAARSELGLAERVLRTGRFCVEGDSLMELRDGLAVLLESRIGVTEAQVDARVI